MKRKSQNVQVGKRTLEVSNLDKVLFPGDQVLKAEIIEYYLAIAPTLLYHIKGRPLTLIRYPDGIEGNRFYQKDRPKWSPEWIEFETLGDEEQKDYIIATEPASLVWLANLAAIELHQMHCRHPHFDRPDYMVFDLDPPENSDLQSVLEIAFELREHIEGFGYHCFVKTTGGKGLHLVVPVEPRWSFSEVFESAKEVAEPYVQQRSDTVTLQIRKKDRRGRTLVDIYRNRNGQSIVSPYSLRGRLGAPVSMPMRWDELDSVKQSTDFNIRNTMAKVQSDGDAWNGIGGWAVPLHTRRPVQVATITLLPLDHRKTAEQLKQYSEKRNFGNTPEPASTGVESSGNRFVIHRHHASRLHYDLRLEQEGVLKSWAVPKGFPPRPRVKRLAVQTEDHPLEYLAFEGTIPKGEYGGGKMWVFATGNYEITKQKENGLYFRLESQAMSGEYRMYKINEREWLLEKVERPQIDWLVDPIEPMLATNKDVIPQGEDYIFELKWDGIRALIAIDDGVLRIQSRNQNDITAQFPELQIPNKAFRTTTALFDAEIVCLDEEGRPQFRQVINRLMTQDEAAVQQLVKSNPAYCYLFDCLYLDGRSLDKEPLLRRREWLEDSRRKGTPYRVSEVFEDGEALYLAAMEHKLEGILAKKKDSPYLPGRRSEYWQKIKVRQTMDCVIIGYTKGKGDRSRYFGALHLAELKEDGSLVYRGKVGTGFNEAWVQDITELLQSLGKTPKPIPNKVLEESRTTWVKPELVVEVTYASLTPDDILREAVFVRLRPDITVANSQN